MNKNIAKPEVNPDENVVALPLDEIVRRGALKMLTQALEAEVDLFVERHQYVLDDEGRRLVVRNGYNEPRRIVTGAGQLEVETPRVDDRVLEKHNEPRFRSGIIPPYLRRTTSINELLPVLYLKGISTGDFSEALQSILGKDVVGLSAETIVRLKSVWAEEYELWNKRDLSNEQYVYVWVDGVYFNVRLDDDRQCILIMIGARPDGTKVPIAIQDGFRESKESWRSIIRDLKQRGLKTGPKLAIGDGSLGFWAVLDEEYPETQQQRCWVHKTGNVLDKLPDSLQGRAKSMIHNIYLAPSKKDANIAFDKFIDEFALKYPKATECLAKDRDNLLSFYDYPAEHWPHLRSTNPIESTFATVRLRTRKTKGCGSRIATLTMVFKLMLSAQKRWKKLRGYTKIKDVMDGVRFQDGIEVTEKIFEAVAA
jgi:transposase-like protein